MAEQFCPQCGAPIEEGAVSCRYCRAPVKNGETTAPQQGYSQGTVYQQQTPANETAAYMDKLFGVLAYFGILVLIPVFAAPKSQFVRFHSNQGLVLFVIEVIVSAILLFLGGIGIFRLVFNTVRLACLILSITGIIAAMQGQEKELPVIGGITLLK